jgi:hypothetical protein
MKENNLFLNKKTPAVNINTRSLLWHQVNSNCVVVQAAICYSIYTKSRASKIETFSVTLKVIGMT